VSFAFDAPSTPQRLGRRGFTILELMIVAAIIGIVAAIAIPNFLRYQANSITAEAKTNLGSLRVAEEAYFAEHGVHYAANPEPALIPGPVQVDFDAVGSDFAELGWSPEGPVYFSYAVAVSADTLGYTADAGADTDDDGFVQLWGYAHPDGAGALLDGAIGCDVSFLSPDTLGRCGIDGTIF
jgi:type IV pilus assembly protein PilA